MSHLSRHPAQDDTHLQPVLFRDGLDRRESARIPLAACVRIGPPGGLPTSLVSASDLSMGGMFVDADREVRVGARFSVEVPLDGGARVYVPEAEVAYNRQRTAGSGFGVRFVEVDEDARRLIAKAIESATGYATEILPKNPMPVLSSLPTITPAQPDVAPADELSFYPEPSILEEQLLLDEPIDLYDEREPFRGEPSALGVAWARWRERVQDARIEIADRARRTPKLFGGIVAAGAASLVAAFAITLWTGSSAQAVEPKDEVREKVPATTHQVLMGKASVDALGAPESLEPELEAPPPLEPARSKAPAKKVTLPPLVTIDDRPAEPAPAPAKQAPSPAAKKILGDDTTDELTLALAPSARVLKTHVLRAPDRYVIDLVDQPCPITSPAIRGAVQGVRSARHPDYCRVVVDTKQRIEAGRWTKRGKSLVVELHY